MMLFKKSIPRRTFLRGVGATVALPFLVGVIMLRVFMEGLVVIVK